MRSYWKNPVMQDKINKYFGILSKMNYFNLS